MLGRLDTQAARVYNRVSKGVLSMSILMECGHSSNAKNSEGLPVCPTCKGVHDGWDKPSDYIPDLDGRMMRCGQCGRERESSLGGAFFHYQADMAHDIFYCGCRGWN